MLALLAAGVAALAVGLFGTSALIRLLRARGVGQPIHEAVTQHAAKAGTPTMGGLSLSAAAVVGYGAGLAVLGEPPSRAGVVLVGSIVAGGIVGAIDDWLKVRRGRNTLGLRERQKTILLLAVAAAYLIHALFDGDACTSPSVARCGPLPSLGPVGWALFVLGVIWLTTNSVNFTDGLDGLLAGSATPPLATLALVAFWQYRHPEIYEVDAALDVALVLTAMAAGCAGLLWWSAAPAAVFMGETGSLAIGTALAVASLALHVELLIPVFGMLFVAEGFSSFAQRYWYKLTRARAGDGQGKRLFRMAPLHHHFELGGWSETTVVSRLWIISAAGSTLAAVIFYADALAVLE